MHKLLLPKLAKATLAGIFVKNFFTSQVTMGQFGQIVVACRKLQNVCRFRQDCLKERLKQGFPTFSNHISLQHSDK